MYYVYMLRCRDGSVYTGIASDIQKRMKIHFEGGRGESKYVRSHGAEKLEIFWEVESKGDALRLEKKIKGLKKQEKEALILQGSDTPPVI